MDLARVGAGAGAGARAGAGAVVLTSWSRSRVKMERLHNTERDCEKNLVRDGNVVQRLEPKKIWHS